MDRLGAGLVGADPPQQVRAGPDRPAPQGVGEETPVGQQQHPRFQPVHQRIGQGGLGLGVGPDLGGEDRMRAALGQRHDPSLRERRPFALVHSRPTEELRVRRRVRDIQAGPVDRDQSTTRQPHTRRRRTPDRCSHPREQRRQRLRTQPSPGLEDRRLPRRPVRLPPPRRPRQPVGQLGQHILIRALRVQRHPDREVRHHPRRQHTMPLLSPPDLRITSSTRSGGNTRVNTPTDTRSDNRRSESGFLHPALGTPANYTAVTLTERYWG